MLVQSLAHRFSIFHAVLSRSGLYRLGLRGALLVDSAFQSAAVALKHAPWVVYTPVRKTLLRGVKLVMAGRGREAVNRFCHVAISTYSGVVFVGLRTLDVISVGSVVRFANVGVTVLHVAVTIVVASRAAGGTLLVAVTSVIALTAVKVAVAWTIARTIARGWAIAIPRTVPDRAAAAAAISVAAATRRSLSPPTWWCTPGCFTTVEAPVGRGRRAGPLDCVSICRLRHNATKGAHLELESVVAHGLAVQIVKGHTGIAWVLVLDEGESVVR